MKIINFMVKESLPLGHISFSYSFLAKNIFFYLILLYQFCSSHTSKTSSLKIISTLC